MPKRSADTALIDDNKSLFNKLWFDQERWSSWASGIFRKSEKFRKSQISEQKNNDPNSIIQDIWLKTIKSIRKIKLLPKDKFLWHLLLILGGYVNEGITFHVE